MAAEEARNRASGAFRACEVALQMRRSKAAQPPADRRHALIAEWRGALQARVDSGHSLIAEWRWRRALLASCGVSGVLGQDRRSVSRG